MDDVERVSLKTRASRLKELYLPKTLLGVDFLVSLPKMKTHHWAGVTLSLKNMFGVVPEVATAGLKTHCTGRGSTAQSWISMRRYDLTSRSWMASSEWKGMARFKGYRKPAAS